MEDRLWPAARCHCIEQPASQVLWHFGAQDTGQLGICGDEYLAFGFRFNRPSRLDFTGAMNDPRWNVGVVKRGREDAHVTRDVAERISTLDRPVHKFFFR